MDQKLIFGPFFALMFLTLLVWIYMYSRRIPFILRSKMNLNRTSPVEFARLSPPEVSNPSDNLKNLFELPTVFYALVLYLASQAQVDGTHLALAWAFVAFRTLHSLVHATLNIVIVRFWLYILSSFALYSMLLRAALSWLASV